MTDETLAGRRLIIDRQWLVEEMRPLFRLAQLDPAELDRAIITIEPDDERQYLRVTVLTPTGVVSETRLARVRGWLRRAHA